jgi:hypothetical protein
MPQKQARKGAPRSKAASSIAQITLRGLEPRLLEEIRRLSQEENLSLNQAALRLLKKGAGLTAPKERRVIGSRLDGWIGTWTEAEARRFLDGIRSCEQVDKGFWA